MRPLDPLSSIKVKLGIVIVAAVGVTIVVVALAVNADLPALLVFLVAGALALLMVQVLAHGMTSPLREMADAASAMARGEYGRRVTATSRDEVGRLAQAFNSMAADLAEVDRMRRDLVANVSHELRTPISALQAVLENVLDGVEQPDRETFEAMLGQVERLGRLVQQLLDLSRLESGGAPLQEEQFAVKSMLERVVQESKLQAPAYDRTVDVELAVVPADLETTADPERLHQVVGNLLDNAVRHSPDGGRVVVAAEGINGALQIEVTDDGPGIAPADAERVFERFYRADAARSATDGGAGLGLSIARWIVELHGGEIHPESRSPHGCRMVVLLPGGTA